MKTRSGLIAALDIGSTKMCCFVARGDGGPRGDPQVVGIGHQIARGLRNGSIVDMEAVEASIRSVVDATEKMAGETIHSVIINISSAQMASHNISVEVATAGHVIGDGDLRRAFQQSLGKYQSGDREIIHSIPVSYSIDGSQGIRDPRGMYGERLGVKMHLITAAAGAVMNLSTCVARCHLDIEEIVVSSYASGLACLVEDEIDLGVTCVDMGGGTTSLVVFFDGNVIFTDSIPLGGAHVTSDIARGLSTTLAYAERIKTLHGNAMPSVVDEGEYIDVPQIGEEAHIQANHVPKSLLSGIIRPRLEETLELVRDHLEASGFDRTAGQRLVLTGGASQMQGVRELAAMILDKRVRTGKPIRISGLAEATNGPAFSTCAGLLTHALQARSAAPVRGRGYMEEPDGLWSRFGFWLRECF